MLKKMNDLVLNMYDFLLVFKGKIWPSSPSLQDIGH